MLTLRFGLDDGQPRTLEELGREFNVTRERIRRSKPRLCASCATPAAQSGCGIIWNKNDAKAPCRQPGCFCFWAGGKQESTCTKCTRVFLVRTCKNKKSRPKMRKAYTLPCVRRNRGLDKNIGPKCEKWLDSKAFEVYTTLVSHNGLVRQKGSPHSTGRRHGTEKFVKNAELPSRIRVDLCVSAQI